MSRRRVVDITEPPRTAVGRGPSASAQGPDRADELAEASRDRNDAQNASRSAYDRLQAGAAAAAALKDGGVAGAIGELVDALVPVARAHAGLIREQRMATQEQVAYAREIGMALKTLAAARAAHEDGDGGDPEKRTDAELARIAAGGGR